MPFDREPKGDPVSIDIVGYSASNKADGTMLKIVGHFQLVNSAGQPVRRVNADLLPHLTSGQILTITNQLTFLRTKGTTEILPP